MTSEPHRDIKSKPEPSSPNTKWRIVVAGSRNVKDKAYVLSELDKILGPIKDRIVIVCGECHGPDLFGREWAESNGVEVISKPADWDTLGKSAGYVRNAEMAKISQGLVLFWDGKSKGSKHMLDLALKERLQVKIKLCSQSEPITLNKGEKYEPT